MRIWHTLTDLTAVILGIAVVIVPLSTLAQARKWTDATEKYSVEADLVAYNDETVVLKKKNSDLVSVKIAQLSTGDRQYLKSPEAAEKSTNEADVPPLWTLQNGLKVKGHLVGYGRRDIVVQRKRGKVYVNDRLFDNLPGVYQQMVPKIVGYFEKAPIDDEKDLKEWAAKTRGHPRKYTCEGVLVELENGDEYGVPFFFFSEHDLKVLQPGWERWLATDQDIQKRNYEEFLLQAQAQAYSRDRAADRQIAQLELALLGTAAGVTNLWEVQLAPRPGVPGLPVTAVVPARDSRQAAAAALRQYPHYVVGPARKLN
jgi:hypothetical protein